APERGASLLVPVDALAALMALLRLDRQGRDRTGIEAAQRNRLARLFAKAIGPLLEATKRGVDLRDQLAPAVPRPKLEGAVGAPGGPIRQIGMLAFLGLQIGDGLARLFQNLSLPAQELAPEIFALALVHEGLVLGRPVIRRQNVAHALDPLEGLESGRT